MQATLMYTGLACILAAIVGGGLEGLGMKIPVIKTRRQKVLLVVFGLALAGMSFAFRESKESTDHTPPLTLGKQLDGCKADAGACTLVLFEYLHDQLQDSEFQTFQNLQAHRLDAAIRNHLSSRGLLEGLDFRVRRCTAVTIQQSSDASAALSHLHVPGVVWGFIRRTGDQLKAATTVTLGPDPSSEFSFPETLGQDATDLLGLQSDVKGSPLAIGCVVAGDAFASQGRGDLARRAFLEAKAIAGTINPRNAELIAMIEARLNRVQASNPAAGLSPIGGRP